MTNNFHNPIPVAPAKPPADSETFNLPLSELDEALTDHETRINDLEGAAIPPSGNPTEYLNGEGNYTVPAGTGASVDGHVIQNEGVDLPQRAKINFVGAGVIVTNEAGGTQVEIPGGGVQSVVAGNNVSLDNTDPENPIVSALGVQTVVAGAGISVDNTDPDNPIVSKIGDSSAYRNLVINGDMQIAQRGTSFVGLTGSSYILDRWQSIFVTLGTWTITQENDVPNGSGFRKSLKFLVTTNDASPSAGDSALFQTRIEGQFLQSVLKGTSSAKKLTISFWIKSNVTGTYIVELKDIDNTRHVCKSFTVNTPGTWEKKSFTIPEDITGTFDNDNAASLNLNFWLGAGSNYTSGTLATNWATEVLANRAVGQVNVAATVNNYFVITGIQVETGNFETDYEYLPFDALLKRCLRYYYKTFPYSITPAQNAGNAGAISFIAGRAGANSEWGTLVYPIPMRASPTVTFYNPAATNAQVRNIVGAGADCSATSSGVTSSERQCLVQCTGNAAAAIGDLLAVHLTADAEL